MFGVCFAILVGFLSGQSGWSWSIHPEAGFKVLTPVELLHASKVISSDPFEVVLHQYRGGAVNDSVSSLVYAVDYYALPPADEPWSDEELQSLFDETVDQFIRSIQGQLVYKDIIHQPGRDVCIWKGSYEEGLGVIRGNILIYEDGYYGLQVFGPEKIKPDGMMTKFLDSFRRITPEQP